MMEPIHRTEAPLLTVADAARMLGVHRKTVEKMLDRGGLEPVYLYPGSWRHVRRADVERIIEHGWQPKL